MGKNMREFDLVLSGCGVNLCAHVGVLDVFYHFDIPINTVVGVSGGAIVGALYSTYGYAFTKELILNLDFSNVVEKRWTPTAIFKGNLYKTKKLDRLLRKLLWVSFKDLSNSFYCIATDLKNGVPVIFGKGHRQDVFVWQAVRASIAAPTIFDPCLGLYDGGIVNNIPIDLVIEHGLVRSDSVLGVRVVPEKVTESLQGFLKLPAILRATINTFIAALDREHIEENVDKVIFVKCPNGAFDFGITKAHKYYHFCAGALKCYKFLNSNGFCPRDEQYFGSLYDLLKHYEAELKKRVQHSPSEIEKDLEEHL